MDIIISAGPRAGKTEAARAILMRFLGDAKRYSDISDDVLKVPFVGDNASALAQKFREGKPEAILFDGCIRSPEEMITAVAAVKKYRQQTGRPRTLAIYIERHPNAVVILSDGKGVQLGNEFKEPKTVLVLRRLVSELPKAAQDRIGAKLLDFHVKDIADLSIDQRIDLHTFALKLKNNEL